MADSLDQPSLILQIEARQNEVLQMLDELESKLESAIRDSQLQVVTPGSVPLLRAA